LGHTQPSTSCTQEEANQASGGGVLMAWGGATQAPRGVLYARGQDPILFWVLPYQTQG